MKNKIISLCGCIVLYIYMYNPLHSQNYNREAAAAYSDKWANGYNTDKYANYDEKGGDCANFVSQCLKAGGLDLSKGGDGNGSGVDEFGCITGVLQLFQNLKSKQSTKYIELQTTNSITNPVKEPKELEMGDVVLWGSTLSPHYHSTFCAGTGRGGKNVYNAHSYPAFHELFTYFDNNYSHANCFHIKPPAHCFNCIRDGDEEDVDCGGSCPSCDRSAPNKIVYNGGTVPPYSVALEGISVQNARLTGNVEFFSAGDIEFLANTEIPAGTSVTTKSTMKKSTIDGDCDVLCENFIYQNFLLGGQNIKICFVNTVQYNIKIWRPNGRYGWTNLVYQNSNVSVNRDGWHEIPWNTSNVAIGEELLVQIWITGCKGDTQVHTCYIQRLT